MEELYWISVIGNLRAFLFFCIGILLLATIILVIASANIDEHSTSKLYIKRSVCTFTIGLFLWGVSVFVPTSSELYVIYGLGTIIDYIKDNDTAKSIPDNALKALDVYFNNLIEQPHEDTKR